MAEEQKKIIIPAVEDITTLAARINELCARPRATDVLSIQSVLKSSSILADMAKPKASVMDAVLKGSALSAVLAAPSKWTLNPLEGITVAMPAMTKEFHIGTNLTALAAMEAQTSELACSKGISQLTSVASQITSISDILATQSDFIRELIAPTSMLTDLQQIAENTHKTILDAGDLTRWQLDVLNSASFMVDRHVKWASNYFTTTYGTEPIPQIEEITGYAPKVNVIELLPEELEYERGKKEDITLSEALENTASYRMSERGKGLVERIVNVNKTCLRKNLNPIFKYSNATMMAAVNLGGTVCSNNGSFGIIIDGLYFIFYENLKHIKEVFSDEVVRNEDVFKCIFRVKDMRTDLRHDYEHGDKIEKKTKNIAESYAYYTGKVTPTTSSDYLMTQEGLYKDFCKLTDYLQEVIEKQA